jgi:hypothetical protein
MQRGDNAELITRLTAQLVDSSDLAELTQCQLFRAVSSDPHVLFGHGPIALPQPL